MTYREAIAALDAQWAAGDMDADEYELERAGIEYAYGEMRTAQEGAA